MSCAKLVGRVGALAVALGVGFAVAAAPGVSFAESSHSSSSDSTALIMGFATVPTWDDAGVGLVMDQFIAPTHPGQTIEPVAVTTPEELWPITGFARVVGSALGPSSVWGPGGPGWPDEPWWKLSGLFDLTWDQSVQAGLADLETAMAAHGNDHLVIYGYSQSAVIANLEKRKLAEQYPTGTAAPDIDFVLGGDPNLPNGGLFSRFPGLHIPIVDLSFNGAEPTDTQFDTVSITRQYDGLADFPLYPLNLIADANAVLGMMYVHFYPLDVSLPADPTTSPAYQGTHGDTSYYFFPTDDLPLFGPLRTLGVPESLIDVVEPFFRTIVELGYDRGIPPWQPTPARLIPMHDPATVADDLVNAADEGINNAAALVGSPAPLSSPTASAISSPTAAVEQASATPQTTLKVISRDVGSVVPQAVSAAGSPLPTPLPDTDDDQQEPQQTVDREPAADREKINEPAAATSVIGNGRTHLASATGDNGLPAATSPARKTAVRDAVTKADSDIKKVVSKISESIQTRLNRRANVDGNDQNGGEGEAQ
jgi:hypothetical protein